MDESGCYTLILRSDKRLGRGGGSEMGEFLNLRGVKSAGIVMWEEGVGKKDTLGGHKAT